MWCWGPSTQFKWVENKYSNSTLKLPPIIRFQARWQHCPRPSSCSRLFKYMFLFMTLLQCIYDDATDQLYIFGGQYEKFEKKYNPSTSVWRYSWFVVDWLSDDLLCINFVFWFSPNWNRVTEQWTVLPTSYTQSREDSCSWYVGWLR